MKPKLFMLCGLPASGKSTFAKQHSEVYNAKIHSSDDIRQELFGDVDNQNNNDKVFNILHDRIIEDLKNSKNTIFDATNICYKKRKNFLSKLNNINCEKIAVMMLTPFDDCVKYNNNRNRKVPYKVLERMYKNFYVPQKYEGFDEIQLKYNNSGFYDVDWNYLYNFNQETPYHELTLGLHCKKAYDFLDNMSNIDFKIKTAALMHDIGKPFCKQYNENKGHYTYYQHHLVSAYNSLLYLSNWGCNNNTQDNLEVVKYITWHMMPYQATTPKSKRKMIDLLGEECYNNIMLLHEADLYAH